MRGGLSVLRLELLLFRRAVGGPLLLVAAALLILRFGPNSDMGPDYTLQGAGFLGPMAIAFAVVIGQTALLPVRWTLPLRPGPLLAVRLLLWTLVGCLAILPLVLLRTGGQWTGMAAAAGMALSGVAAGALFIALTPSGGWQGADRTSAAFVPVLLLLPTAWVILGSERMADSWTTAGVALSTALLCGGGALLREGRRESRPGGGGATPSTDSLRPGSIGRSPLLVQASLVWGRPWGWGAAVVLGLLLWAWLIRAYGGLGIGPVWAAISDGFGVLAFLYILLLGWGRGSSSWKRGSPVFGTLPLPRLREFRMAVLPRLLLLLLVGGVVVADAGNRKFPGLDSREWTTLTYSRGDHLHGVIRPFVGADSPEAVAERAVRFVAMRYGVDVDPGPIRAAAREGWVLLPYPTLPEARRHAVSLSLSAIDPVLVPDLRRAARERTLFAWLLLLAVLGIQARAGLGGKSRKPPTRPPFKRLIVVLLACILFALPLVLVLRSWEVQEVWFAVVRTFQRGWPLWTLAWAMGMVLLYRSCEKAWTRLDAEDLGLAAPPSPEGDL